jgi:hypothetical protein
VLKLHLNSLFVFGLFCGNPAGNLERRFSRMDGAVAKMCAGRWWVCRMSQKNAIYWNWF